MSGKQPSALILGAAGYIGGGVARAFRRAGWSVHGIGRSDKSIAAMQQMEVVPIKGSSFADAGAALLGSADVIVDAVGFGDPKEAEASLKTVESAQGNRSVLFIYTSGIMTYGSAGGKDGAAVTEDTLRQPILPDMGQRRDFEDAFVKRKGKLLPVLTRPGFVYGGHGGVIATMFYADGTAHGSRNKRWSWVHVDDLGEAYVLIANADKDKVVGQAFNLASRDNAPRYGDLRSAMAGLSGVKLNYVMNSTVPRVKNWETSVVIDPSKAESVLGWKHRHVPVMQELPVHYAAWKQAQSS